MTIDCPWWPMHQSAPPKVCLTSRPLCVTGRPGIHSANTLGQHPNLQVPYWSFPHPEETRERVPRTTVPTSWQEGLLQAWLDARSLACVPPASPSAWGSSQGPAPGSCPFCLSLEHPKPWQPLGWITATTRKSLSGFSLILLSSF